MCSRDDIALPFAMEDLVDMIESRLERLLLSKEFDPLQSVDLSFPWVWEPAHLEMLKGLLYNGLTITIRKDLSVCNSSLSDTNTS
jgi:hypothetical protein